MGNILVVGVGNTVMRDDGLGVHALEEIRSRELPEHVDTIEAGTALIDALPDLREYRKVIFIDAVQKEGDEIHIVRNPASESLPEGGFTAHEMGIDETLRIKLLTEGSLPEIVIMGLKPEKIEFGTELSEKIASQIPELVDAVFDEIKYWRKNHACF